MKNIVNSYVRKFQTEHRERRKLLGVLLILALVVAGGVVWRLHSIGIAVTDPENVSLATLTDANLLLSQADGTATGAAGMDGAAVAAGTSAEQQIISDGTATATDADGMSATLLATGGGDTATATDATDTSMLTSSGTQADNGTLLAGSAKVTNQDIEAYADADDDRSLTINLTDTDSVPVTKDEDGNYNLVAGEEYFVQMIFKSLYGMDPGTYYYEFPSGITLFDQSGSLVITDNSLNEVVVGEWTTTEGDGTVYFTIYDNINDYTNISLSSTVTVMADGTAQEVEIGNVTYKVVDGNENDETTVDKRVRSNVSGAEEGKLYWEIKIEGGNDHPLAGATITDVISDTTNHWFTADDISEMYIKIYDHDSHGHVLTVSASDVTLTSVGDGKYSQWQYTLPESFYCSSCGQTIYLPKDSESSAGWIVRVYYSSTMKDELVGSTQYIAFGNEVQFYDLTDDTKAYINEPNDSGSIVKYGEWSGTGGTTGGDNMDEGCIYWSIEAVIPATTGLTPDGKYTYRWELYDSTKLDDARTNFYINSMGMPSSDIEIKAYINGVEYVVPNLADATASDPIAWSLESASETRYNRTIQLWCQCKCSEETCQVWKNGECSDEQNGFCRCWHFTEPVQIIVTYKTDAAYTVDPSDGTTSKDGNLVEDYAGHYIHNSVSLEYDYFDEVTAERDSYAVASDSADVTIPGMLDKTLTQEAGTSSAQIASYSVSVNEAMVDLSDLKNLTVVDSMSDNLSFVSYSVAITATAADGTTHTVNNFTVSYQPFDSANPVYTQDTDGNDVNANVATIVLDASELGPYMYTITYNAVFYYDGSETRYSNTVSLEAYGETYSTEPITKVNQTPKFIGENYSITIEKVDAASGEKLSGAVFGIYNQNDQLIVTVTTGADGTAVVKTDRDAEIYFFEHTLYYIQEIDAPTGYVPDSTRHWFWFCNKTASQEGDDCTALREWVAANDPTGDVTVDHEAATVHSTIQIQNHKFVPMPTTGGEGVFWYLLTGIILTTAAVYLLYRRSKPVRERRCVRPECERRTTRQIAGRQQGRDSP